MHCDIKSNVWLLNKNKKQNFNELYNDYYYAMVAVFHAFPCVPPMIKSPIKKNVLQCNVFV